VPQRIIKTNTEQQDIRLIVEIKNDRPLELIDLTKSLT